MLQRNFGLFYCLLCFYKTGLPRESSAKQTNVVLFFAQNDRPPKTYDGLKILQLSEITRVKLDVPTGHRKSYPYVAERNVQNCEEMLWDGLDSLAHFCQNALGMKTATVSVSSDGFSNAHCQEDYLKTDSGTKESKDEQRPRRNHLRYAEDEITHLLGHRIMKVITDPRHTEVFKIRVKRDQPQPENRKEIQDVPLEKDSTKPDWDVLDIISHVRLSFFGKLFNKDHTPVNDSPMLSNAVGKSKSDPGLFESVMTTLGNLQETSEPFLLVVYGGRLSTTDNVHSPLVQAMKHVTEDIDPVKTLLVLSPGCPRPTSPPLNRNDVVSIVEGGKINESLPVFAIGPKSEKLKPITTIYDIPLTIKSILEEMTPNFGENSNMKPLSYDSPKSRVKRNSGYRNCDVIFTLTIIFSFYVMWQILFSVHVL